MKLNIKKMTLILGLISISLAPHSFCQMQTEISGELKYMQADNGRVFLAVDSDKQVTAKADGGDIKTSKLIQLAIETKEMGEKAMELIGKRVTVKGTTMAAHTAHHHTPVLLVTNNIEIDSGTKTETQQERIKPTLDPEDGESEESTHSQEWGN
jgi:hypothetical protein